MTVAPLLIKKARDIGLSMYEAKCYLALLERDTLSVTEIATLAKVPRVAAYEALASLHAKGFCTTKPGKIKQYSAVDPSIPQEKAIRNIEIEFDNRICELDELREKALAEKKENREHLSALYDKITQVYNNRSSSDSPLNYIEILKEPYQIHKRVVELMGSTKTSILSFSQPPFTVSKDLLKEQVASHSKPLKEGVVIKSIYVLPESPDQRTWLHHLIEQLAKAGEQVRIIDSLPIKMIIFDEKRVIFQLEDPVTAVPTFTTQIIDHSSLALAMKLLFNSIWEKSIDFQKFQLTNH